VPFVVESLKERGDKYTGFVCFAVVLIVLHFTQESEILLRNTERMVDIEKVAGAIHVRRLILIGQKHKENVFYLYYQIHDDIT